MANNHKIVQYPRRRHINIGVIIFLVILIYVFYHLISWASAVHIAIYEVEYGTIASSNTYPGLILRSETIVNTPLSGELNFYLKEGSKASVKTLVCSVDETGTISTMITGNAEEDEELKEESLSEISAQVTAFTTSFDRNSFYRVYPFKEDIVSRVMEARNLEALSRIQEAGSLNAGAGFHMLYAPEPGIVEYYTDGYETITPETVTPSMLNEGDYQKTLLRNTGSVNAGSAVYKLINSEDWSLVLEVEDSVREALEESGVLSIRFLSDDFKTAANYRFIESEGAHLLVLTLNHSMVRYAGERFTEVELLLDQKEGLKIPNTAIVDKTFFLVPKQYFTHGGNTDSLGLLKRTVNEEGETSYVFVPTDLFFESEESYYIEEDVVKKGDLIKDPGTGNTYPVQTVSKLSGVFNVNKGYAAFRKIDPIYSNAEYTIVKTGTPYGLSLYDHIALNGADVTENQLI